MYIFNSSFFNLYSIYDDVDTNLKAWKDQGKLLYIYSSGSVNAQKLLFGNTNKGNLLNVSTKVICKLIWYPFFVII